MKLQNRDISLFKKIHKYQFLTTNHIHDLVFTENFITIVRRRLHKLVKADYLGTLQLYTNKGTLQGNVYYLKPNAYTTLELEYKRRSHPKKLLAHTVEMISTRIHFDKVLENKTSDYLFRSFQTEREFIDLDSGKKVRAIYDKFYSPRLAEYITVTPDIKFVFERKVKEQIKSTAIFVEIDRGTENLAQLRKKVKSYHEYFDNSGKKFQKKFEVTEQRFVVLFLTTTQRRIDNILDAFKLEYGIDLFVFGTFKDFYSTHNLTEEVWTKKGGQKVSFIKKK